MKIIIKKSLSQETLVNLHIDNPSTITIGELANLFFQQLSRKYVYSIGATHYTERNHITPEDFTFFIEGRRFTMGGRYAISDSNQSLADYVPSDQQECLIYANLAVYGKFNYRLPIIRNKREDYDFKKEQFDEAILKYDQAVKSDPNRSDVFFARAKVYWDHQKYLEAYADYTYGEELRKNEDELSDESNDQIEMLGSTLKTSITETQIECLFQDIQKLPEGKQIYLLNQCMDKKTFLGEYCSSGQLAILKIMRDYLNKLKPPTALFKNSIFKEVDVHTRACRTINPVNYIDNENATFNDTIYDADIDAPQTAFEASFSRKL